MSAKMKQLIENIKELSSDERALLAHCLISSLETKQDDDVEEKWAELSESRFSDLTSGRVEGTNWEQIKKNIKG